MKLYYSREQNKTFDAKNVITPAGLVGSISWHRLCALLESAGEIKSNERLLDLRIDENGLTYGLAYKSKSSK